nr:DUF3137 domain-containing protein [uncultured Anaerotignum sp.]
MEQRIQEEQLEKMRLKAKNLEKVVVVLSVVMLLVYIAIGYLLATQENGIGILSGMKAVIFIAEIIFVVAVVAVGTGLLLWLIIVKHAYDKFNLSFKSKYVQQVISSIEGLEKLEYVPKGGFTWDDVRNAAAVNCGDKRYYDSEDLLMGEYENIRFQISDVCTRKMVRMSKKNRVEEIFSGQMICLVQFDDTKRSNGHIQIFEKKFMSNMIGWKVENEIHTENEIFNSRFSVFAYDEHNAYYILTPQRMEKIMYFADVMNGQVSFVFRDEKLFVAVRRDSMFDASMDEPVSKQTRNIIEDAEFIQMAKEILIAS